MRSGAHTPEELETLLEDALLLSDANARAALFEDGGVLAAGFTSREARGADEIASFALGNSDRSYLANPRRILQARDTALVVADGAINVARCGEDGAWRYAIALLFPDATMTKEDA
jgi:hypothetical protein